MKFRVLIVLTFAVLLLAACDFSLAEDITPPPGYVPPTPAPTLNVAYPANLPSPARGADIYAEKCLACHGEAGLGNGPQAAALSVPVSAIGLRDIASQSTPADWYTVISMGRMDRFMPPFTSLTEQERWDVLAYVYMLGTTPEEIALGEESYALNCAECHGDNGQGASAPALDDPQLLSNSTAISLFRAIYDGAPGMPAFSGLPEGEIWALTAYLRSLAFDLEPAAVPEPTPTTTEAPIAEDSPEATPGADGTPASTPEAEVSPTPEPSGGTINGIVVNGSGGEIPADLVVTLIGYDPDMVTGSYNQVFSADALVDPDGSFVIQDVELTLNRVFLAVMVYNDQTYQSDPVFIDVEKDIIEFTVTFYEDSTDTSGLTVDRVHVFFDFTQADIIQVVELFVFSNSSTSTVVAAEPGQPVTRFAIPAEASNLQFQDGVLGDRYVSTEDGFGDTSGIAPGTGTHQVIFAYDLPYKRKLDFSFPVNYPVASVLLMVPEGIKLSGDGLVDGGVENIQGTTIQMYTTENLAAGDTLTVTISGKPKTAAADSGVDSQTSLVIGLGGLGILLIGAGVYFFIRDRSKDSEEDFDEEDDDMEDSLTDAESIMDAIIALDEQHKSGAISEDAYHKRRAELKGRLKGMIE